MTREKIMLGIGAVALVAILLVLTGVRPGIFGGLGKGNLAQSTTTSGAAPALSVPANGFFPGLSQSQNRQNQNQTTGGTNTPVYKGTPVTSLDQVAAIVSATTSLAAPNAPLLIIPSVSDSEINVDPAGVSTTLGFLAYFNEHSTKDIVFDANRLNSALKDANGVVLLAPDLIDQALAQNDFGKIRDSLIVQKDFANAEIAFVRSIRVTGDAATVAKRTIGTERLLASLIDNALAVGANTMAQADFVKYYNSFTATMMDAREKFVAESGVLAAAESGTWFTRFLAEFGVKIGDTAFAQTGNLPFGGQIGVPIPCTCSFGYWVTVGPPKPALLFVPFPFVASPLFFLFKSLTPGVWWLGSYNPALQLPCLQFPFCTPIGTGGAVIMAGTSLFP